MAMVPIRHEWGCKELRFQPARHGAPFRERAPKCGRINCCVTCANFQPRAPEQRGIFMAKRRGNPNWGKPEPIGPVVPTITSFEQVVKEYKLTPDQYIRSTRLREWARRNKNSKYIPEALLEAWGFEIESTL